MQNVANDKLSLYVTPPEHYQKKSATYPPLFEILISINTGKPYKTNLSFLRSPLVSPSISIISNIIINGLLELANFKVIVGKS